MDRALLHIFFREIALQCLFIEVAAERLEPALKEARTDEVWLQLQIILTSAANVSKLLWGSGGNREADRANLRDALDTQDDSVLRDPDLRNDFEHFDERVERWYEGEPPRIYMGRNIAPEEAMQIGIPLRRFQHFDPNSREVTFWDNSVSVSAVVAEAHRIHLAAKSALDALWPE